MEGFLFETISVTGWTFHFARKLRDAFQKSVVSIRLMIAAGEIGDNSFVAGAVHLFPRPIEGMEDIEHFGCPIEYNLACFF